MRKYLLISLLFLMGNTFAETYGQFIIKNHTNYTVTFHVEDGHCMGMDGTDKYSNGEFINYVAEPNSAVNIGFLYSEAVSSGGNLCATDRSYFKIIALDETLPSDLHPQVDVYLSTFWDAWNMEHKESVRLAENGHDSSADMFGMMGWGAGPGVQWDYKFVSGQSDVTIDYYACAERNDTCNR